MGFNLIYWTPMGGFYILIGSILEKCGKFWKKRPFFRADLAGLGKYRTGGFGRIGVYRVNSIYISITKVQFLPHFPPEHFGREEVGQWLETQCWKYTYG